MNTSPGIHHITAITGDPQKNLDFYEGFLGQRLVKRTVNFDDPRSYHFYFADYAGSPGTLLTFFYFGKIPAGSRGTGEVGRIAYAIPETAKDFWLARAKDFAIPCSEETNAFGESLLSLRDSDNMIIDLLLVKKVQTFTQWEQSPIPKEHQLAGFYSATLSVTSVDAMNDTMDELGYKRSSESDELFRFTAAGTYANIIDVHEIPDAPRARQGLGSVHHIAFRAENDAVELLLRSHVESTGLQPTHVIDRKYFHSVYFMTPGQILFEIATDNPGMSVDESTEFLGEHLVLPSQFEPHRSSIEKNLIPITLPRNRT